MTTTHHPLTQQQQQRHQQHQHQHQHQQQPQIYSARYFSKSPTWFAWNRLSASDIHSLYTNPGFEGQNIYFHLNHPVRFVKVVGIVTAIESVGANGRFTLITLDDGSGRGIVGKVVKKDLKGIGRDGDGGGDGENTVIQGLSVGVEMGLPSLWIGGRRRVEVGMVISVKGTLEVFRGEKQVDVKRLGIVESTEEEVRAWEEVVRWRKEVVGRPWVLSEGERREVDQSVEDEMRRKSRKSKQKREYQEKRAERAEKKRLHEEEKEARRLRHEKKYNKGAIRGSDRIRAPWD